MFEKFEKHFKKKNVAAGRIIDFNVMKNDECDTKEPFRGSRLGTLAGYQGRGL